MAVSILLGCDLSVDGALAKSFWLRALDMRAGSILVVTEIRDVEVFTGLLHKHLGLPSRTSFLPRHSRSKPLNTGRKSHNLWREVLDRPQPTAINSTASNSPEPVPVIPTSPSAKGFHNKPLAFDIKGAGGVAFVPRSVDYIDVDGRVLLRGTICCEKDGLAFAELVLFELHEWRSASSVELFGFC